MYHHMNNIPVIFQNSRNDNMIIEGENLNRSLDRLMALVSKAIQDSETSMKRMEEFWNKDLILEDMESNKVENFNKPKVEGYMQFMETSSKRVEKTEAILESQGSSIQQLEKMLKDMEGKKKENLNTLKIVGHEKKAKPNFKDYTLSPSTLKKEIVKDYTPPPPYPAALNRKYKEIDGSIFPKLKKDTDKSLSRPVIVKATQSMDTSSEKVEDTETIGHSQGDSIQQLEEMIQTDKYSQSSESLFSNEIFSEIKKEEDMEVDWLPLPRFDHYDSDEEILSLLDCDEEEILELRNRDGVMPEDELVATMDAAIDDTSSLYPEVEQLEENDQAMVRIGGETENRACGNQIAAEPVEIQTVVESKQSTVAVSISTSSLFYKYEDPFWQFERKERFSQILENHGASRTG